MVTAYWGNNPSHALAKSIEAAVLVILTRQSFVPESSTKGKDASKIDKHHFFPMKSASHAAMLVVCVFFPPISKIQGIFLSIFIGNMGSPPLGIGLTHPQELTKSSHQALAVAGLSVVGRDRFGVFPLRGKLRNVAWQNL